MRLWQDYVRPGAQFVCDFVNYLRGAQDYLVEIRYEYTGVSDTCTSVRHILAQDAYQAVSKMLAQERVDPYGAEPGWKSFEVQVKKVVD